jgi:hypothetical protein
MGFIMEASHMRFRVDSVRRDASAFTAFGTIGLYNLDSGVMYTTWETPIP